MQGVVGYTPAAVPWQIPVKMDRGIKAAFLFSLVVVAQAVRELLLFVPWTAPRVLIWLRSREQAATIQALTLSLSSS